MVENFAFALVSVGVIAALLGIIWLIRRVDTAIKKIDVVAQKVIAIKFR